MRSSGICFQFRDTGRCTRKGCKFVHRTGLERPNHENRRVERMASNGRETPKRPQENNDFFLWRRNIPLDTHDNRPLGQKLASFFREGRRIIEVDDGSAQEVVSCIAKEGGLKRIRELIERDFAEIPDLRKKALFKEEILPFLEIVTHTNVLASLILEQAVGTIYNFIFGQAGQRAVKLLNYLVDVLQLPGEEATQDKTDMKPERVLHLEVVLLLLKHIVDLNSTAFVCEPLKDVVRKFEAIYLDLHDSQSGPWLQEASVHLQYTQRRLEIGSLLPKPRPPTSTSSSKAPPKFITPREPPGGRHNNDHADICLIKVMPTLQEIRSVRSEYLPPRDPNQWHVHGVEGLLDRNFRLLREDTVGQLRDAIQSEIIPNARGQVNRNSLRKNVYRTVKITGLGLDIFQGLCIKVDFPQPISARKLKRKEREEWWKLSKRLQASALVFLTDYENCAVFCTVIETGTDSPRKGDDTLSERSEEKPSLWKGDDVASVTLGLVKTDRYNISHILQSHAAGRNSDRLSLIEFPGVLLPSFQPTLLALQRMKRAADLPFADLLVSAGTTDTQTEVPPPLYASHPGFFFDLQCLTRDNSELRLYPDRRFDTQALQNSSDLDEAQAKAVVNSLTRKLGPIQGPPGTGKSYTGIALVKVLLANKEKTKLGPIVCVCYTNHALDQFLEDLLEKKITSQIIRIGSKSKSELIQPLNLRKVVKEAERTKAEKRDFTVNLGKLKDLTNEFSTLGLNRDGSLEDIKSLLERNYPSHYQQLFEKDADGWERYSAKGSKGIIEQWLLGGRWDKNPHRTIEELEHAHVDTMTAKERKTIHSHWLQEIQADRDANACRTILEHGAAKSAFDNVRDEIDLRCLRAADVIGVTTTGLARNLNMLRRLQSKVVICEEAGEVLEAHLLTALLPSVQHAILIGDHLQLRPQIQNYELSSENSRGGDQYALDVSLFERLVDTAAEGGVRVPFSTLETQRRMHPSIADLIRDTLYPKLEDAPSVFEYPQVIGMRHRLFWLDHREPEAGSSGNDAVTTSHWNEHEIGLTAAVVKHLISQGKYKTGDIAVLTPYLGQLHRLRAELMQFFTISVDERDQEQLDHAGFENGEVSKDTNVVKTTLLQSVRVATVDNFQGEEAKVIVISLVRSNKENRCGFLRTSNRINVLLSRAKHGMYIIGNSATSSHVPMWAKIINILQSNGSFGTMLELQCPRHPDTPISVSEPDHFTQFSPEGGCNLRCTNRLSCGHACIQKCHSDALHNAVHCLEDCPRALIGCDHPCPKRCGDKCPTKCTVSVHDPHRVLSCGHPAQYLPCWQAQDLSLVRCSTMVMKTVPGCNHHVREQCCVDVTHDYKCKKQCQIHLPCGHSCKRLCHQCSTRDESGDVHTDHGTCKQKCGRNYSTCGHSCITSCHGELPCPPCNEPCDVRCGHSKCSNKCHEPCVPCAEDVCLSACPHSKCSMPCSAPCDHIPCSKRCEKKLDCGHQCPSVCGEPCPPAKFCQICADDGIKSRDVDFIMGQVYREIDLDENPCIFPQCGHFLTVESMDGQFDLRRHYKMDVNDRPIAIASSSEPFSIDDIKKCATCRGSLRDIARYGRLVRRALLDECTKKFILHSNNKYISIAGDLMKLLGDLRDKEQVNVSELFKNTKVIRIEGPRNHQIALMSGLMTKYIPLRWRELISLRKRLMDYYRKVSQEEQPYQRVRNKVEDMRRRKKADVNFEFDESVLQTKGVLMATALSIRLDTALLADFLSLRRKFLSNEGNMTDLHVDFKGNRQDCEQLVQLAADSVRVSLQVEGLIFLAQLYALERPLVEEISQSESMMTNGMVAVKKARELCETNPGQTAGLLEEVDEAEKMLNQGTFYTAVTNAERLAVIEAMAREFRGTGHWYYCSNGHPFTIGECGMPMQLARCPECGAPVGGQHHQQVAGVRRADDLEESLRGLNIA